MFEDYVIPTRRRTAEDVFAVLVGYHEQWFRNFSPDTRAKYALTMETTIFEWCCSDLIDFPLQLRENYNRLFRVNFSKQQWHALIEPERKRTLGGLCRAIADAGSTMDVIEPVSVFGQPCRVAGVFAMLMAKLRAAGVETREVAPSSPLNPIAAVARTTFEELAMLHPQLTLHLRYSGGGFDAWLADGFLLALLATAVLLLLCPFVPTALLLIGVTAPLCGLLYLAAWVAGRHSEDRAQLHFKQLATVGDLCRFVAAT